MNKPWKAQLPVAQWYHRLLWVFLQHSRRFHLHNTHCLTHPLGPVCKSSYIQTHTHTADFSGTQIHWKSSSRGKALSVLPHITAHSKVQLSVAAWQATCLISLHPNVYIHGRLIHYADSFHWQVNKLVLIACHATYSQSTFCFPLCLDKKYIKNNLGPDTL